MTVTTEQKNRAKSLLVRDGKATRNPAYSPGVEKRLSLDLPEETLLKKGDK